MRYGIDANQRIQNVFQWSVIDAEPQGLYLEDEFFVLTQSYIETFVENPALEIKPDRTLMLRYELKYGYRADALNHFFYDSHRENVSDHIVTTTVAAFWDTGNFVRARLGNFVGGTRASTETIRLAAVCEFSHSPTAAIVSRYGGTSTVPARPPVCPLLALLSVWQRCIDVCCSGYSSRPRHRGHVVVRPASAYMAWPAPSVLAIRYSLAAGGHAFDMG